MDGWESGAIVAGAAIAFVVFLSMAQRPKVRRDVTLQDIIDWHKTWHLVQSWIESSASTPDLSIAFDRLEAEIDGDRTGLLSQIRSILDESSLDQDLRVLLRPLVGTFFSVDPTTQQPPTTTPPVVPGDNGEVVRLEAELAAKVAEVEASRRLIDEKDAALAANAEGLRTTRDALTLADAELATLRRQLADADQSGTIAALQQDLADLRQQLASQPADQSGQVAALTAELDQSRAQRDADLGAIAALNAQITGYDGDMSNLRSQMAQQGAQLGEAVAALEACRAASSDTTAADALNAEIVALRSAADAAQAQLAAVANERDSLASQVGSSAQVAVDRDAANARAEAAEAEVRRLNAELSAAVSATEVRMQAEVDSIRGLLAAEQGRANAGVDVLAGKDAEIAAANERAANAENRAGTLDLTLSQLQAAQGETAMLHEQLSAVNGQYVAATDGLANETARANAEQARADALQATLDALRAELGAAAPTPSPMIDPVLQAELDSLRGQTQELVNLRAQLASQQTSPPPELVTELDSLRAQVSAHQATDAELSALRAQVAELSAVPAGIPVETLAAEQARAASLQAGLDSVAAELNAARMANDTLQAQYAEAIARLAALTGPPATAPVEPPAPHVFDQPTPSPIMEPAPLAEPVAVQVFPPPDPEPIVESVFVPVVVDPPVETVIPEPVVVSEEPRPALIEDVPPTPASVVEVPAVPFEVAAGDPVPQVPGNADATDRDPVAAAAPWMAGQHVEDTVTVTPVTETIADLGGTGA